VAGLAALVNGSASPHGRGAGRDKDVNYCNPGRVGPHVWLSCRPNRADRIRTSDQKADIDFWKNPMGNKGSEHVHVQAIVLPRKLTRANKNLCMGYSPYRKEHQAPLSEDAACISLRTSQTDLTDKYSLGSRPPYLPGALQSCRIIPTLQSCNVSDRWAKSPDGKLCPWHDVAAGLDLAPADPRQCLMSIDSARRADALTPRD
jgi:hypothetical protein